MKKLYINSVKCFFVISISIISIKAQAYNSFWVNNPLGWEREKGTIENAYFTIEPKGLYLECQMELTLSAAETNLRTQNLDIEAVLDFDLPAGSMITHAYLLIGDSLVEAKLMEAWAAEAIYENIVHRVKRDPLLLKKYYNNRYTAKIYPMVSNSTRTFKITYLIPAKLQNTEALVEVPLNILSASKTKTKSISITVKSNSNWQNPKIKEYPEIEFKSIFTQSNNNNKTYKATLQEYGKNTFANISFNSSSINNFYFTTSKSNDENFYQLVLNPYQFVNDLNKETTIIIKNYQVYISPANGFSYSQFNLNNTMNDDYSKPVIQMGKYFGDFPIEVKFSAKTNLGILQKSIIIENSTTNLIDETAGLFLAGNEIEYLENNFYDKESIKKIIELSMENNILSRYTSFIALEPDMEYKVPEDNDMMWGENIAISIEEPKKADSFKIQTYPNPFVDALTINLIFENEIDVNTIEIRVLNFNGEVVKTFNLAEFEVSNEISIKWDGKANGGDELPRGIYLLYVKTPNKTSTFKIVKVE